MENQEKTWERMDVVKRKKWFVDSVVLFLVFAIMTIGHFVRSGTVGVLLYVLPLTASGALALYLWFHSEKVRKEYEATIGKGSSGR